MLTIEAREMRKGVVAYKRLTFMIANDTESDRKKIYTVASTDVEKQINRE